MNIAKNNIVYIKGMVCPRCIKFIENICDSLNLDVKSIELGAISFNKSLNDKEKEALKKELEKEGFSLLDNKHNILINSIKTTLVNFIQNDNMFPGNKNLSDYLSEKYHYDYSYLSNLFTTIEGKTIEKYLINLRIEKIKELLIYDELTIDEIAFKMNYSSTAYLSSQFKKIIGVSPSQFKKMNVRKRKSLDEI